MMGERRLLDVFTDRMTLGRRMRILRHRTARWFLPPIRQNPADPFDEPLTDEPRLRVVASRPPSHR
jgi:hypothetical protein